jgi:hypothetical protein
MIENFQKIVLCCFSNLLQKSFIFFPVVKWIEKCAKMYLNILVIIPKRPAATTRIVISARSSSCSNPHVRQVFPSL